MAYEHAITRYRNWYATLLRLYPKPYRERFGEGMEQTFNDLCRERHEAEDGLFGFVLWVFVETSVGIIRENIRSMSVQNTHWSIVSVLVGILVVGPFFALQWYTTSGFSRGVPWAIFTILFVEAIFFSATLLSALGDMRERVVRSKWLLFTLKIVLLVILSWSFVDIVADQMPCFLGGRGC